MNKHSISKRLTVLRGEESQEDVADAIGISKTALSMYESGVRIPRDEVKRKLASYYHTNVADIFFNHNDTNSDKCV